jgi:cytochrome c biogenesis protein
MTDNIKCECGHLNHVGTVLCESCGKPLADDDGQGLLEMRYDGVARRSQKANPNVLDRVWNFFSSVKVAVYLIVITLVLASLGTIFRQENTFYNPALTDMEKFYREEYGLFGQIYYSLGLSNMYESWWFRGLLLMIGTSLVICSLDRVLPLYRALSKQKIRKHLSFITRQRVALQTELDPSAGPADAWLERFAAALRARRYKVHMEDGALLAEKNRFSRWGPYINHIGLIIFLLATLLRTLLPGWSMEEDISFIEGETKAIAGTPYYLKIDKFVEEFYTEEDLHESMREKGVGMPKRFEAEATLYACLEEPCGQPGTLEELARHQIIINEPLKYDNLAIYLFYYEPTDQIVWMNLTLEERDTRKPLGQFELDMFNPAPVMQAGEYEIRVTDFFPEFIIRDGAPATKSREPRNPGVVLNIAGPGTPPEGYRYLFVPKLGIMEELEDDSYRLKAEPEGNFYLSLASVDDVRLAHYKTYLSVRSHVGMWMIWLGAAIFMIGVVMGFYWQHRRIWVRLDGRSLALGAHTNKNWMSLRREVADALTRSGMEADQKDLDNEVKRS